jgi:hypothetical protein
MRRNRLLLCATFMAAAASLASCSSSSSTSTSPSPSPSPSARSTTTCQYTSDQITAVAAVVQVRSGQSNVERTVSPGQPEALPCDTTVSVGGEARVQFGTQGGCTLQELNDQPASLTSRDPTPDLATLNAGWLTCDFTGPIASPGMVQCPGYGTVVAQDTQLYAICVPGTTFEVWVYRGSATVVDLRGKSYAVAAKMELYAKDGTFKPKQVNFTHAEMRAFSSLAATAG